MKKKKNAILKAEITSLKFNQLCSPRFQINKNIDIFSMLNIQFIFKIYTVLHQFNVNVNICIAIDSIEL